MLTHQFGDTEAVDQDAVAANGLVLDAVQKLQTRLILAGGQVYMGRQRQGRVGVGYWIWFAAHIPEQTKVRVAGDTDAADDMSNCFVGARHIAQASGAIGAQRNQPLVERSVVAQNGWAIKRWRLTQGG